MRPKMATWICGWSLLLLMATFAAGQEGKRLAVIVGVNDYADAKLEKLKYADDDARGLATLLKRVGYEVTLLTDSDGTKDEKCSPAKANIESALKSFEGRRERLDTVLFAFIGHGIYFPENVSNYFCPRDAQPSVDHTDSMIALKTVYSRLDESGARVKVLLADVCRINPDASWAQGINASTAAQPPQSVVALFSCSKGERAFEHKVAKHGFFTHFLMEGMHGEAADRDGEVTFDSLTSYIQKQAARLVPEYSGDERKQRPGLKADSSKAGYVFLSYSDLERLYRETPPLSEFTNSVGMVMKPIPAGEFMMGNEDSLGELLKEFPYSRRDWFSDATPQRKVQITRPFLLAEHEVTVRQFQDFVESTGYKTEAKKESTPSWNNLGLGRPQTPNHPVVNVSWNDAVAFCEWLSREELKSYRLPTEAEWEYACRGGTKTRYWFGSDPGDLLTAGNTFDAGSREKQLEASGGKWDKAADELPGNDGFVFTAPVGSFAKNPFGLYDTIGNVEEWCSDWYQSPGVIQPKFNGYRYEKIPSRVLKGGSWNCNAARCRSAHRYGAEPKHRSDSIGFRVACSSTF